MSRMDRYKEESDLNNAELSRVKKNDSLYEEIKTSDLSKIKTNNNIKVLENSGKTINLSKIKKYLETPENNSKNKRNTLKIENDFKEEEKKEEQPKIYDINTVIESAKKNREIDYESERYKKLRDTQFDILSKIKMYESNIKEDEEEADEELNTDERTLVDLINTVTIHKGEESLLGELIGGETEEITLPINEEREKALQSKETNDENDTIHVKQVDLNHIEDVEEKDEIINEISNNEISSEEENNDNYNELEDSKTKELVDLKEKTKEMDNSFYTSSMTFSKEDFEGFEELERSTKKSGVFSKIMLVILVIFIIASMVLISNYVFNLGLF